MNLSIRNLSKAYNGRTVLSHLNLDFESGQTYCLMGASGSGKTTLLRILLGLEHGDEGSVVGNDSGKITAVFQENRLCESFSPVENIMLSAPKKFTMQQAKEELQRLLPLECLNRPVSTLSGGMKRRVAICRAVTAGFETCLMDEPFTGLDEDTKQTVIGYIKEKTRDRLLIVSTHQEEDIFHLKGIPILISMPLISL